MVDGEPNEDVRRAIVAYGNASTRVHIRGLHRFLLNKSKELSLVKLLDEFRTFAACCHRRQRLQNIVSPVYIRNLRKKNTVHQA